MAKVHIGCSIDKALTIDDGKSDAPTPADEEVARAHPEDYCHRCSGPNCSWYAPSLLWNQFVRDRGEPEIICPICFVELAVLGGMDTTWSMVPDSVTSDYDERLAVRAAQRIINATLQSEEEAMVIVRDALVQSAAALATTRLQGECTWTLGFDDTGSIWRTGCGCTSLVKGAYCLHCGKALKEGA
jgi:hypothetical protein